MPARGQPEHPLVEFLMDTTAAARNALTSDVGRQRLTPLLRSMIGTTRELLEVLEELLDEQDEPRDDHGDSGEAPHHSSQPRSEHIEIV